MYNPYKKEYKKTSNISNISNNNTIVINMNTKKQQSANKNNKLYKSHTRFKCKKCKFSYNNKNALVKHSYIHINPVYCYFPKCDKVFSPKHTYQYRQHMDSHNGGLHIKCKFCAHISRSLSSNTLHMKAQHKADYNIYMKNINEYNKQDLENPARKLRLNIKYIDTAFQKSFYKKNSVNTSYTEINNLYLFADIALSYC